MPALPELEVLRRDLEKEVVGRRIKEVEVRPGSNAMKVIARHGRRKEFQGFLEGAKVDRIDRVGRYIMLELDNDHIMVVDLGVTGQLVKTSASGEVVPHTHIVIGFTIGGQLRFIEPKMKGRVFVGPKDEVESDPSIKDFAVDPLDNRPLPWHDFSAMLEQRQVAVKDLLVDDSFIVGLGDIYSDEVLFTAGLRHDRKSDELSSQDVRRLYRALLETMQEAVKARGTSFGVESFKDLQGNAGGFQEELKVYEREGEPCRRCRQPIMKEKFNGNDTYFCQQCQS